MKSKFYNHEGTILWGRNWPEVPEIQSSIYQDEMLVQKYKREMKELIHNPIRIKNPELLPHIPESNFLDCDGYEVKLHSLENGYEAEIISKP